MPAINKKSILTVGLVLIIMLAVGASQRPKQEINNDENDSEEPQKEVEDEISFTEGDLDSLGKSIEDLEFDDLGGLSLDESADLGENSTNIELSELDLDKLGELLQALEFEDLGGLSEE